MSDDILRLQKELGDMKLPEVGSQASAQPWSGPLVTTLSICILVFSALVLLTFSVSLRGREIDGTVYLKLYGLTLIVSFSALLMVTGYGQDQLTPVIGLFGAIAGYLLGKDANAGK